MHNPNLIVAIALAATLENPEQGASYLERPAGSKVDGLDTTDGMVVAEFLKELDWTDVTDEVRAMDAHIGACRYYRAEIPEGFAGREGIALVNELSEEMLEGVRVRKGHHGNFELYHPALEDHDTNVVHLLVADISSWPPSEEPTEKTAAVVTWYPGRITSPVDIDNATVKQG